MFTARSVPSRCGKGNLKRLAAQTTIRRKDEKKRTSVPTCLNPVNKSVLSPLKAHHHQSINRESWDGVTQKSRGKESGRHVIHYLAALETLERYRRIPVWHFSNQLSWANKWVHSRGSSSLSLSSGRPAAICSIDIFRPQGRGCFSNAVLSSPSSPRVAESRRRRREWGGQEEERVRRAGAVAEWRDKNWMRNNRVIQKI